MSNLTSLVQTSKDLAYSENDRTKMPIRANITLATEKGIEIAKKLDANVEIVEIGTYLMDCLLGQAIQENRIGDHISMSLDKTNEILQDFDLSEEVKENIRHCVSEHHGVEKFHSLESEIVCNADCYRFVSVKGFFFTVRYLREMPYEDLVKLLHDKVDEKWSALSLEVCKEELSPEHEAIVGLLKFL